MVIPGLLTVVDDTIYFFFNDTATTEIYTLSLHDALPISVRPTLLLRAFRVLNERAIRVDDVAVVVRGRAADDGGLRLAVLAVGLYHVGLRCDGVAPGSGETVLEGVVPAVVLRELLDVGGA